MKISHEVPLSMLTQSREFNDYCYALVHLFETHPEYYNFYKESIALGRTVILDNSVFELETAFDSSRFAYWIQELQPSYYIIPDVLDDANATVSQFNAWIDEYYLQLPGKMIAVVQGKTFEEALWCYTQIMPYVDKVAISFNCKFFEHMVPNDNKLISWSEGRKEFMEVLRNLPLRKEYDKPHHLLGSSLPNEFKHYTFPGFEFIESLDTSNPIVHGLLNIRYDRYGLQEKRSVKLVDMLDAIPNNIQMDAIIHNVTQFRALTV